MIDKIKKISIERLIFISIMILLIGLPIIAIYTYTCYCFNFKNIFIFNRAYLLWWGVPFLLILYVFDIIFNKKKVTYIDVLMYLLIILGVLSTIFAVNTRISLFGEYTRNEGLLSLLSYYFILLNLKNMSNEKYKKIIIKTIIVLGIVQFIYGVLQSYTNWSFILHHPSSNTALGLCGHPNFYGSYMVMLSSFVFAMYMQEGKKKYLVLSLIFFVGLCLCYSTGPFISFILAMVFFIVVYRKKIKWRNLLKIFLLYTLVYLFVNVSVNYVHSNILNSNARANHIESVIKDFKSSDVGHGRVKLWKESLPLVKKYWVIGAGIDNFGKVYNPNGAIYYDKAHNVYLQIAITNGVFALAIYMALMLIIFLKGLKMKDKVCISLFIAFVGYCIQAFANISVVEVAPTFFVICGLLLGKIQKEKTLKN